MSHAPEAQPPVDNLEKLLAMMKPGFNRLAGNEELEAAYLAYQADVLDAAYEGTPNFMRVDQLPEREQAQIATLVQNIAAAGLASPTILSKRLDRIRILAVNEAISITGETVGGHFRNGLATVSTNRPGDFQNHARIHEIVHGLTQPGPIAAMSGSVSGLGDGLACRGHFETNTLIGLASLSETVVDTWALSVSDLDLHGYLSGKLYPDFGYWQENHALAKIHFNQPDLAHRIHLAAFSKNVHNNDEGALFAEAYVSSLPASEPEKAQLSVHK